MILSSNLSSNSNTRSDISFKAVKVKPPEGLVDNKFLDLLDHVHPILDSMQNNMRFGDRYDIKITPKNDHFELLFVDIKVPKSFIGKKIESFKNSLSESQISFWGKRLKVLKDSISKPYKDKLPYTENSTSEQLVTNTKESITRYVNVEGEKKYEEALFVY